MVNHGFPWLTMVSMVNHGYLFLTIDIHGSEIANHCKNIIIFIILELIPRFTGFPGIHGNGVKGRKPDPPKHAQESSDDVSFQQTPSKRTYSAMMFHG